MYQLAYTNKSRIRNPLVDISREQLLANVHDFATEHQLTDVEPLLVKGALLAQSPALFEELEELDEADRTAVREEITHRFKLPRTLYFTIILNSVAAAIQGWDQTGSNGANLTFGQALGIPDSGPVCEAAGTCEKNGWIIGFINACPYIAIAGTYMISDVYMRPYADLSSSPLQYSVLGFLVSCHRISPISSPSLADELRSRK